MIYLDYNATAPVWPEVVEVVAEAMRLGGNPSSVHGVGRAARARVELARARVAGLAGCRARDVIFTSGGTEANNLALKGAGRKVLLVSATEHDSVLDVVREWQGDYGVLAVDRNGVIDMNALRAALPVDARDVLVSVMLANNETGIIQPVAEVAALAHERGALVHCDAVQAAGKIGLDFRSLGIDMMTLSAHKIGGPQGVGALVLAPGLAISPLLRGGGQELGRRSGTENVPGIVGFGKAAELAHGILARMPAIVALRDDLERRLTDLTDGLAVAGAGAPRVGNTSCIVMPGVAAETQIMAMDLAGICVSAGAACSSGKVRSSHVLTAMGLSEADAKSAIRVSLGWNTRGGDIDAFLDAWMTLYDRTRAAVSAAR